MVTCIVGLVDDGRVWMGGDSAGVDEAYGLMLRTDKKVFQSGPFLIGFTTSFRMGQLLQHSFTPPDHDPRVDVHKYMVTAFVNAIRACFKEGGYARIENGVESSGEFLVGYKGRLFVICGDYQVGEPLDGFAAVGCGAQIAHGALFATRRECPRDRIRTALEAAERFSAGVRAPFVMEHSE